MDLRGTDSQCVPSFPHGDEPPFDGAWPPETEKPVERYEGLTCGIGCFVTALLGVVAWWLWRAMN